MYKVDLQCYILQLGLKCACIDNNIPYLGNVGFLVYMWIFYFNQVQLGWINHNPKGDKFLLDLHYLIMIKNSGDTTQRARH